VNASNAQEAARKSQVKSDRAGAGFAAVYDVIHGTVPAFFEAQMAYLTAQVEGCQSVLDAGCGTGRQMRALREQGYRVTGLDASRAMLEQARRKLDGVGRPACLAQGWLQRLPFAAETFHAALCLESPLAYLASGEELQQGLGELRRVLRPGARLLIDVFDYLGTLGAEPIEQHRARFVTDQGEVRVLETHHYDPATSTWQMRQTFRVIERSGPAEPSFTIEHYLHMRSADEYAAAIESAGFAILELLPAYPQSPRAVRHEARFIFSLLRKGMTRAAGPR
jgi:ubiquinone/menaquinone biosynthesis C-methylase UbiE